MYKKRQLFWEITFYCTLIFHKVGDYIRFIQHADEQPDQLFMLYKSNKVKNNKNMSSAEVTGPDDNHGSWYYNGSTKTVTYIGGSVLHGIL